MNPLKTILTPGPAQLNAVGIFLSVLLIVNIYYVIFPWTPAGLVPLACLIYALVRIVYELTINRANVPTFPTSLAAQKRIITHLKTEAAKHPDKPFVIADFGSGRGGFARRIARAIPSAQVVGFEFMRWPYLQSKWLQRLFGPSNLSFEQKDFFTLDARNFNAVLFYLTPSLAKKVGEKLLAELPSGASVLSYSFPLQEAWPAAEVQDYKSPFPETLYIYRKS